MPNTYCRAAHCDHRKDYASCDQGIAAWNVAVRDAEQNGVRFAEAEISVSLVRFTPKADIAQFTPPSPLPKPARPIIFFLLCKG